MFDIEINIRLTPLRLNAGRVLEELNTALDLWAAYVRDRARENVARQMNISGRPGGFEDSIQAYRGPGDLQRTVLNTHPGAAAQEYGAVIVPKSAKALHFFVDGHEVFTQKVTLPARPYLRPAVEDSLGFRDEEIAKALGRAFSL